MVTFQTSQIPQKKKKKSLDKYAFVCFLPVSLPYLVLVTFFNPFLLVILRNVEVLPEFRGS